MFCFLPQAENKVDGAYLPLLFDDLTHVIHLLFKMVKTKVKDSILFSPLFGLMDDTEKLLEEVKTFTDKYIEKKEAEIKDYEEKLGGMMKRITHLEVHKDEL